MGAYMKTTRKAAPLAAALITFGSLAGVAEGAVLTFDEEILNFSDYQGFTFSGGFSRLHTPSYFTQDTGYVRGNISPDYTAFTAGSGATVALVEGGIFDFDGMHITAAWQNGLTVNIEGFLSGSSLYSQQFIIDDDSPTYTNSNFMGIDRLQISTIGGLDAGTPGNGNHVAIDNFTVNSSVAGVPEPSSALLLGLGALGVVSRRKRTA